MASFFFSRRSRIYGNASVFGHIKHHILTVWGILTQYGIGEYPSDTQYYIIEGSLIVLLSGTFFFKKRYRRIITKYENENTMQSKAGAWILTIYIVVTLIGFFIEALYRQGKI